MNLIDQYQLPKYNDPTASIITPVISSGLQTTETYEYSTEVPYTYTEKDVDAYMNLSIFLIGSLLFLLFVVLHLVSKIKVLLIIIEQQKETISEFCSMLENHEKDRNI